MSIREKLAIKILGYLEILHGYLNVYLRGYYQKIEEMKADAFLKKFRSHREDPNNFSSLRRRAKITTLSLIDSQMAR
jgi:hypothetical protein